MENVIKQLDQDQPKNDLYIILNIIFYYIIIKIFEPCNKISSKNINQCPPSFFEPIIKSTIQSIITRDDNPQEDDNQSDVSKARKKRWSSLPPIQRETRNSKFPVISYFYPV